MSKINLISIQHDQIKDQLLKDVYNDEESKNVVILCHDGEVKAHRFILVARSKYFFNFLSSFSSDDHPIIVLQNVSVAEASVLLQYLYFGKVQKDHLKLLRTVFNKLKINENSTIEFNNLVVKKEEGKEGKVLAKIKSTKTKVKKKLTYSCSICDKSYSTSDHLDDHIKIQHKNILKNYSCKVCGHVTAWSNSIAKHIKSKHPHVVHFKEMIDKL